MSGPGLPEQRGEAADSRSVEPRATSPATPEEAEAAALKRYQALRQDPGVRQNLREAAEEHVRHVEDVRRRLAEERLNAELHQHGTVQLTDEEADLLIDEGLRANKRGPSIG